MLPEPGQARRTSAYPFERAGRDRREDEVRPPLRPCSPYRSTVQHGGGDMPEPHGDEAEHDRQRDIAARFQPMVLPRQLERLQAEGGKGGEPAADSEHDKG